jgi:outer membrane protein assembly factor BamA
MLRSPCTALVVLLALGQAGTVRAQAPAAAIAAADVRGRRITGIRILLDGLPAADPDLPQLLDVVVGQPLDPAQVRSSIEHLTHLRRFAAIDVFADPVADGVVVRVELASAQRIGDVRVEGALRSFGGAIERAARERLGSAALAASAPEAIAAAQDVLGGRGYLQPRLATRIDGTDRRDVVTLVIIGDPGPRWLVGTVRVTGVPAEAQAATVAELGLAPGMPYDREDVDRRVSRYTERLRGAGYYEAVVRTTPVPGQGATTIDLTVDVARGPMVTLTFEGDALPESVRRELVPVREEASVDEDLLEDSRARITTWLQERGYWRARVSYSRRQTDAGLDVVFTIARGRVYQVQALVIGGAQALPQVTLRQRLDIEEGKPFTPSSLASGIAAITQLYQNSGFPAVRVEQALVDVSAPSLSTDVPGALEIRLRVAEGTRATVSRIAFEGVRALDETALRSALTIGPGQAFSSAAVVASREAVLRRYLDDGYRQAQIEARLENDATPGQIAVTFVLVEGRQTLVDRILVVGNVRTSEDTIRRELRIERGQPYGLARVFESQRRLTALGLFRSVRIVDVGQANVDTHDVIVTVEEAPVTTVGYGAGLQGGQRLRTISDTGAVEENFEFAARGFFEAGRRNLWGKNRTLNFFMRASVRPRDYPGDPERDGTGLALNEYRVLGTWREPRAFLDSANLDVAAFVEQAIRSSFSFRRQQARVDWSRLFGEHTTFVARYAVGRTELYDARIAPDDQLNVDRLFPQVRISSVTNSVIRDTRDDPLDPGRGTFMAVDGELAGRAIGSEVGFAKTLLQGFVYRRLPGSRRIVIAGGARLGLARGLPRDVSRLGDDGQPLVGPDGQPLVDTVTDLPAAERFFAGGDNTVRGFAQDRLGEPATLDRNGLPTGGNALLIFNSEVRVPVWRGLIAAAFVDAGNVFLRVSNLDITEIRGAAGFGIRYLSPIGPIRVDLGFKLDRLTFANGTREGRTALHITVGQAF